VGVEVERRHLTVMFCDLVGSTARLDPEDLRAVIGAYHSCVAAVIERAGGFVAKYMGDGVLAYFGYPRADEHDAERAVRAGLALVEASARLDSATEAPLRVRVGIATGLVVVGDLIGQGSAQERSVLGETPNLAARLQALAQPDAVIVTAGTRRLLGDLFEYRSLGAVEVRGFAGPVQAWQVLRSSIVESRFEAFHAASLSPLVGREEEIELLLRRWARAKEGDGQIVLVSGEAGIGKSRIVAALQERLGGEPYTRLRYFGSPHHADSPLHPVIAQVERAAGFAREDAPGTKLNKLETLLSQAGETSPYAAALIADLLAVPNDGRYPPLPSDPRRQREETFAILVRQFEGLARAQRVLVVFEDVHCCDSTSLELLDVILERVPRLPVLVVITFRPEFQPHWTVEAHVTLLTLGRLGQRETAALAERVAGGKPLPAEILVQIVERADGIPLFTEELTKALLEGGLLREQPRHCLQYPVARPTPGSPWPDREHAEGAVPRNRGHRAGNPGASLYAGWPPCAEPPPFGRWAECQDDRAAKTTPFKIAA
jgi:class 3 adenylate cyclase